MSLHPIPLLRGLALGALFAGAAHAANLADTPPVSPEFDAGEILFDRTQPQWSEAYLQWVAAFARDRSPVADTTGAQCGAKQEGEVWFLAASNGTGPVVRACTVPAGKALFVPIVNRLERSGNAEPNCASMARVAASGLPHMSKLSLTVDGVAVEDLESHRLATGECFALGLRGTPRLTARTAVADGYGVMLRPLPAGPHVIVVGAQVDAVTLSTTYRLTVQ